MSKCVISQLPKLKELSQAKPKVRKIILEKANLTLIKSIIECEDNVLRGNIPLNSECMQKLRRHKKILRNINSRGDKISKKKQFIVQSGGGFIPILLSSVLPVLAEHLIRKLK